MSYEPMTLDTDDAKEALRQIANYLRTVSFCPSREVLLDNEPEGFYQRTEWLQGLIEIANECDRVRAAPLSGASANRIYDKAYQHGVIEGRREGEALRAELLASLEILAKLGNGDSYGNSEGNIIAQKAIAKAEEIK